MTEKTRVKIENAVAWTSLILFVLYFFGHLIVAIMNGWL